MGRTHTGAGEKCEGEGVAERPSTFMSKLTRNTTFSRCIHLVAIVNHGSAAELHIQTLGKLLSIKLLK